MGQKIHPHGFRVGVTRDWDSRWYAGKKTFPEYIQEDFAIRRFIKRELYGAGVSRVEIERYPGRIKLFIHTGKPGVVIGRGGAAVDQLRSRLERMTGKKVSIDIREIRSPDTDAQLVAESVAAALEKRVSFKRVMKQAVGRAMRQGARGIRVMTAGRLGGAEMHRREWYWEGTVPLHTLRADIDYGFAEAKTTYGQIGVKVWIHRAPERVRAGRGGAAPGPAGGRA
ncbi:MAG: 30S ribosomal protein S3, partial [Firmicutes bacterium]|nr:30S ribosomal protein S3 [Bacillota bacterium]